MDISECVQIYLNLKQMGDSFFERLIYWVLIIGYLNWFYTVGASFIALWRQPKNRLRIFRFALTLLIPWVGGLLFWIFPLIFKEN